MLEEINQLNLQLQNIEIQNTPELEKFRLDFLSKKGHVNRLFEAFRNISPEIKKEVGKPLNIFKKNVEMLFEK